MALCQKLYDAIGASGEEIKSVIVEKSGVDLTLDAETITRFVDLVKGAGNYKNSPYVICPEEMVQIYTRLFGK